MAGSTPASPTDEATASTGHWTSAGPEAGVTPWQLVRRRFMRHHLAVASGIVLLLLAIASLCAPLIAAVLGQDVEAVDLFNRFAEPSTENPLGTDELGRDLLLRLLYGGQVSLFVGLVGAVAAALIGTIIGVVAGYAGGRIDAFLMRLTDAVIALPLLPLLIILAALDFTKLGLPAGMMRSSTGSLYIILGIVALVGWTTVARLVRGATLSVRERGLCTGGRGPRRRPSAHHPKTYPSERRLPDHRRHNSVRRQCHPHRIDSLFSRPRHSAALAELGQHADQCARVDLAGAGPRDLARPPDLRHRHRVQFPRRWPSRCTGPSCGRPRGSLLESNSKYYYIHIFSRIRHMDRLLSIHPHASFPFKLARSADEC